MLHLSYTNCSKTCGSCSIWGIRWGASYTIILQTTRMWELGIRVGELDVELLGHVHILWTIMIIDTNIRLKEALDIQGCLCSLVFLC